MEYRIEVGTLLGMAFGQRLNLYQLDTDAKQRVVTLQADEQGEGLGLLGLPVFQSVVFSDPQEANGKVLNLNDCLVDISMTRNIVKTPVVGRDGTVKEFISNGDFDISIKGLFINQAHPDVIPQKQITEALRWFQKNRSLQVSGKIFDIFKIFNIVVESFHMPQVPTFIGMRPFELKCVSDTDYIIDLDNNV